MARPGLMKHRKFLRLAQRVGGPAVARGHLELLWDAAYECGEPYLGDATDVEILAGWQGQAGQLVDALMTCGGDGAGFIEEAPDRPGRYQVHDLWHHAPDYVRKRWMREAERRTRRDTFRQTADTDRSVTGQRLDNGRPPAPVVSRVSGSTSDSKEREGVGGPGGGDASPPDGGRLLSGPGGSAAFAAWFDLYGRSTGRRTTKKESLEYWPKLPVEIRESILELTAEWVEDREAARRAGVFVPEAKDPVRFLRHRRWEDRLMPAQARASPAELSAAEVDRLSAEHLDHGGDVGWAEYQDAVLAGKRKAGTWHEWQQGQAGGA